MKKSMMFFNKKGFLLAGNPERFVNAIIHPLLPESMNNDGFQFIPFNDLVISLIERNENNIRGIRLGHLIEENHQADNEVIFTLNETFGKHLEAPGLSYEKGIVTYMFSRFVTLGNIEFLIADGDMHLKVPFVEAGHKRELLISLNKNKEIKIIEDNH